MASKEREHIRELYEFLIENSSLTIDRKFEHFTGSGFVVSLEGYNIQVPSVMINYKLFEAILLTYVNNIEGEIYLGAWLDENLLVFNFDLSIIDDDINVALSKAEARSDGSIRTLVTYRIKKLVGTIPNEIPKTRPIE